MTNHFELVGSIRRSLIQIRDHYDEALIPPRLTSGVKLPTEAGKGTPMKYAGKVMKHSPAPVDLGVLDARIETHSDLSHYCRVILFEVTDINGNPIQTKLHPEDPIRLASFIDTWADRLVEQVPMEAEAAERDLSRHARTLKAMARPERRTSVLLGDCPVTVSDAEGSQVACGTKVRAYPDEDDVHRFVKCPGCGTEDTVAWWMSQILPEATDLAHLTSIIAAIAAREQTVLTHAQVRMWASRGFIQRHGHDLQGRTLYSTAAVLAYVRHQTREEGAA